MLKFSVFCWLLQLTFIANVIVIVSCQNRYSEYARVNLDASSDIFSDNEKKLKSVPQDLMIDVTNLFGLKILYSHSERNNNNIALSPCGLASVMIALFEGADGKSALEIHKALGLPWDRDMVRIGFRDIHRRLRTYFYKSENILSGLSLSRENITFRSEYENILRFYGYEVSLLKPEMKELNETTNMPIIETTTIVPDEDMTTEIVKEVNGTTTTITVKSEPMTTMKPTKETETTTMSSNAETTTLMNIEMDTTECEEYIDYDDTTTTTEMTTDETTEILTTTTTSKSVIPLSKRRDQRSVMEYEIISNYNAAQEPNEYDSYPVATPTPIQPQYNDYDDSFKSIPPDTDLIHFFYLTNFETIRVPYKFFNTILKYAYIDELRSAAIELQLDSENYNMLILLPDYDYGLDSLQYALTLKTALTLRDIKKSLRITWVKAIVPQFNLKGNIILTSDLQNLGISDIFEPTHADFTPMTYDDLVYTRHIEQAVTVNIRTQRMEQLLRQSFFKSPVEVSVNHPFLFFVIDTEIDLAIINGRVLNPLNSRIQ